MKMLHALMRATWRPAVIALALVGAFSATASAAVSDLTINDTAKLSPGMLHATLTGTIRCDPGDLSPFYSSLSGQITQAKGASGYGGVMPTCDGTVQPFSIDVSSGGILGGGGGPFKSGKANAQVSTTTCDPLYFICTSTYVDAVIHLTK